VCKSDLKSSYAVGNPHGKISIGFRNIILFNYKRFCSPYRMVTPPQKCLNECLCV